MASWYYQADLNRQDAEAILSRAGKDGAFLIRDSESIPGAYSLCLWASGKLHQYRIVRDKENQLYIKAEAGVEERKYSSLDQLVDDYMSRKGANGLAGPLIHPVPRRAVASEYELEQTIENEDPLTNHFQRQLQRLDLSKLDGDFIVQLKRYVDNQLYHDARRIKEGSARDGLLYFRDFMRDSMGSLIREVEYFHLKLSSLQELFCGAKYTENGRKDLFSPELVRLKAAMSSASICDMLDNLSSLQASYTELEAHMVDTWRALLESEEMDDSPYYRQDSDEDPGISRPLLAKTGRTSAYKHAFYVKTAGNKFKQRNVTLLLDLKSGHLMIVRENQQCLDQSTYVDHDKIRRVGKSTSNNSLLTVHFRDRKKEVYLFEKTQQRELFCQLVSHMKRLFCNDPEPDVVSVFVGTWNMGGEINSWSLIPWLKSIGEGKPRDLALSSIPHDLYAIGTQESAGTEKEWERAVKMFLEQSFSIKYETIQITSLWGIRLLILCKPDHKQSISNLQTSCVRTGFRNTLGNKGAVGVSFNFCATTLCFINSHLTSGSEKNLK